MDKFVEREIMTILYYFFCIIFVTNVVKTSEEQAYLRAHDFFMQGKYNQAISIYENIEPKNFAREYNCAVLYLYEQNLLQALVHVRRAEQYAHFYQLTQLYRLQEYIEHQLNQDFTFSLDDQLAVFCKKCILSISMLFLQIGLLIVLLLLIWLWYRRWYVYYKKIYIILLSLALILLTITLYKMHIITTKRGIVSGIQVAVLAGPDNSFQKKSILSYMDEVVIKKEEHGFYQINCKNIVGWVARENIERI